MRNLLHNKKQKGFTLIELLIVIAIIGILAGVVLVALSRSRVKSRDAKRVADLRQIATALEVYYSENESYPVSTSCTSTFNATTVCLDDIGSGPVANWIPGLSGQGADAHNPKPYAAGLNTPYGYTSNNPNTFVLFVQLEDSSYPGTCENAPDLQWIDNIPICPLVQPGYYQISKLNTAP